MTAAAPLRTLHSKLAEVMAEADRIPKNGTAPSGMGGYKFVQVGDAADAIRTALASRKVSMIPSAVEVLSEAEHETKSGGTMTTQTVRTTWTLTDGESGETATIQSLGTGADAGDKFSPKAQTNAMKYALLMGFLLSTGDDPELSKDANDRKPRRERFLSDRPAAQTQDRAETAFDAGLVGTAEAGKGDADFLLRQSPDGWTLVFRLTDKKKRTGIKVIARDGLAELIDANRAAIQGLMATCWGAVVDAEPFTPDGATRPVTYQVLNLSRIKVGALDLTEPEAPEDDEDALIEELGAAAFGQPTLLPAVS